MKQLLVVKNSPRVPLLVLLESLLIAFYADMKPIAWALGYGGFGFAGDSVMGLLYPLAIAMIFIISFPKLRERLHDFYPWLIIFPLFLLAYYYFTKSYIGEPRISLPFFFVFTISSFLVPQIVSIDAKIVIKLMMIVPSFAVLHLDQVFFSMVNWANKISMDASYAFLIPITATVCYLFLYFKEESKLQKIIMLVFTFVNIVFLWKILSCGSRGPIVSVIAEIVFLIMIRKKDDFGVVVNWGKVFIVSVIAIIISATFENLLAYINGQLLSSGFEIRFFQKFYDLALEGDLAHGRDDIAAITMSGFWDSPIWGNGIDQFETNTGGEIPYPHNFLLQILYDGGLLLLCMLIPVAKGIRNKYKNCTKDQYAIMTLFLFASAPGALFSQDLWNIAILWMFFGIAVSKNFVHE